MSEPRKPPARPRVLLVEDNPEMAAVLREAFEEAGFEAACVDAEEPAVRLFEREPFDLAVLDIGLREGTGLGVCRRIRAHPTRALTPVVILSADADARRKEELFAAGADNYLVKPIKVREVLLWAKALIRRANGDWGSQAVIRSGELSVDCGACSVESGGRAVRGLTFMEFRILTELARTRPRTLARKELERRLWGTECRTNTLDVHVKNLRRKLGLEGAAHIVTVKGIGYRFE